MYFFVDIYFLNRHSFQLLSIGTFETSYFFNYKFRWFLLFELMYSFVFFFQEYNSYCYLVNYFNLEVTVNVNLKLLFFSNKNLEKCGIFS